MKKLLLYWTSLNLSLILVLILYRSIVPLMYFVLYPIFTINDRISDLIVKMMYYILVILLSLLIKKIISKSKIFDQNYSVRILILNVLISIVFVLYAMINYSDFPFKTSGDENNFKTKELNKVFSKDAVQIKSVEYDSVENRILAHFSKELENVSTDEQFQHVFRIYGINDKNKMKVLVDTIIFSPDKRFFVSSILFHFYDEYISASVIGENTSNGKILNNYESPGMSGSDSLDLSIKNRYFYFLGDSNSEKNGRFRINQKEYWIEIEKKISIKNACP